MNVALVRIRPAGAVAWCVLFSLVPVVAQGQVALRVADGTAACDAAVKVPVTLSDPHGLGALDVVFSYDPELLEFEKAEPSVAVEDATFLSKTTGPGKVRCGLISTTPVEAEGVIFTLRFRARGKTGVATIAPENPQAWAARNAFVLRATAQPGTWTLGAAPSSSGIPLGWIAGGAGAVVLLVAVFLLGRRSRRPPSTT